MIYLIILLIIFLALYNLSQKKKLEPSLSTKCGRPENLSYRLSDHDERFICVELLTSKDLFQEKYKKDMYAFLRSVLDNNPGKRVYFRIKEVSTKNNNYWVSFFTDLKKNFGELVLLEIVTKDICTLKEIQKCSRIINIIYLEWFFDDKVLDELEKSLKEIGEHGELVLYVSTTHFDIENYYVWVKRFKEECINISFDLIFVDGLLLENNREFSKYESFKSKKDLLDDERKIEIRGKLIDEKNSLWTISKLRKEGRDNFEGWSCSVGLQRFFIDQYMDIYRSSCKIGGTIGNLNKGWELPKDTIICNRKLCKTYYDVHTTKELSIS